MDLSKINERLAYLDSEMGDNHRRKVQNTIQQSNYESVLSNRIRRLGNTDKDVKVNLKDCIAPCFYNMHADIRSGKHSYYDLKGGRGSTKSSFVSIEIVNGMAQDPNANAVVYRKVGDTLASSVYEQILWAIDKLEMASDWHCTRSPLQCEYIPYGTKILFKGLDRAKKSKSIKFSKGYAKYLWFEEFDEYSGAEEIRSVQQSVLRGGDKFFIFKSMNPPKSKSNWANAEMEIDKTRDDVYVSESTYLSVPQDWLGQQFIDDAEWLKETKPEAYRHEYLGEMIGTGADIFENIESKRITDEEIYHFDNVLMGLDWGWYPDPLAWTKVYYDSSRKRLYIYDELHVNKKTNREVYELLVTEKGVTPNDIITCDSAEPKSIGDLKVWGLLARGAEKGVGSIEAGIKWLQSLDKIIIDPSRCPHAYDEFVHYELELDKDGEPIDGAYPDFDNHHIDSVRYACERYSKRRGE